MVYYFKSTPPIRGKAAIEFLKRMHKEEVDPDPERIAFIESADEALRDVEIIL